MTKLRQYLDGYFAGVYFYFLMAENHGQFSTNRYFAYSTILLISALESVFVAAVSIWLGIGGIFSEFVAFGSIALLVLIFNWNYYVRKERFALIAKHAKNDRARLMRYALLISIVLFVTWISVPAYFIFFRNS